MKERPILFSTLIVQAILNGNKTQTRRIVKPSKGEQSRWLTPELINDVPHGEIINGGWQMHHPMAGKNIDNIKIEHGSPLGWINCPYGKIGDILWVRETWLKCANGFIYRADHHGDNKLISPSGKPFDKSVKWKPSIFMPREACRILLEVMDVRVERLQEITEEDAKAEGITDVEFYPDEGFPLSVGHMAGKDDGKTSLHTTRVKAYTALWGSINGKGSWEKNPWVWVIEFKRIEP